VRPCALPATLSSLCGYHSTQLHSCAATPCSDAAQRSYEAGFAAGDDVGGAAGGFIHFSSDSFLVFPIFLFSFGFFLSFRSFPPARRCTADSTLLASALAVQLMPQLAAPLCSGSQRPLALYGGSLFGC